MDNLNKCPFYMKCEKNDCTYDTFLCKFMFDNKADMINCSQKKYICPDADECLELNCAHRVPHYSHRTCEMHCGHVNPNNASLCKEIYIDIIFIDKNEFEI
jgi:hypothetical protein